VYGACSSPSGYAGYFSGIVYATSTISSSAGASLDQADANNGSLSPGLKFGTGGVGEGIASKRTATGNQYGLDFYTRSAVRMSITSDGKVGIGTSSPQQSLSVQAGMSVDQANANAGAVSANGLTFGSNSGEGIASKRTAGGNQYGLDFYTVYASRMSITNTGNVGIGRTPSANRLEVEGEASKTTAGSWAANSDARIKEDVAAVQNALDVVDRLRPVQFRYTDAYRARHPSIADVTYYNFIAQEFREVFPDYVKDSGEDGILQVDTYPALICAVAAVKELRAQVATLEARLAALERAAK
jgi:hypothetical protein